MDNINVKKANNGFIVTWIKYLKPDERIDSQITRSVCMVAKNVEELLEIIYFASNDVNEKYKANEAGLITK